MFISKRMLIIIGVVGVIVLGALGFAFAFLLSQVNVSSANANATPTPTVAVTSSTTKSNRACAFGVVQSIDSQNQSFVVSETKGKRMVTVTVNTSTTFHKRGNPGASFSSLAAGERVRVTAQGSCDRTATTFVAQAITVVVSAANLTPTPAASITPTP